MTESIYITMRKNFCFYGGKERKGGNLIYPSIIEVFDKMSRAMTTVIYRMRQPMIP